MDLASRLASLSRKRVSPQRTYSIYTSSDVCPNMYRIPYLHMNMHLYIYLSIYLSFFLSIYLSIYPSIYPSIYHLSIYPSIIYPSIDLSIYLSICQSVSVSVCLCVCVSSYLLLQIFPTNAVETQCFYAWDRGSINTSPSLLAEL